MKRDKAMERLLESADTITTPPEGIQERVFNRVISAEIRPEPGLSRMERMLFEKPLRAACVIAVPVTGFLWAVTGGNFIGLLRGLVH